QERLRLIPPLFRSQPGQELIARHKDRRCSPTLDALNLRWRSRVEHENSAWNAELVRRVSAGLGGVSGANRDQPPAELPRRKGQGGREKAADLEATCRLEALELQRGAFGGNERSAQHARPGSFAGRADALARDHR